MRQTVTPLHLPTLFLICALIMNWLGLLMLVLRDRTSGGGALGLGPLGVWAVAVLVGAAGLLVAGELEPPLDRLAGNSLLLLAAGLSWTAARLFAERSMVPWVLLGGPLGWLAVTLTVPALQGVWPVSTLGAVFTAATFWELWRCRPERLPALPVALLLLFVHAGVYFARALVDVVAAHTGAEAWIEASLLIEGMLHTIGMGLVLLALTAERSSARATEVLRQQAMIDGLTGLANRRQLDQRLAAEHRRATRHGSTLALMLIDADHFKRYNDRYGHLDGDTCLRTIAASLSRFAGRSGDLAARFGGEEFALLLPGISSAGAAALAEQVRLAIRARAIPHLGGVDGRVTVSIGVAVWDETQGPATIDALLRRADRALYAAKAAGRDTVCTADAPVRAALQTTARVA